MHERPSTIDIFLSRNPHLRADAEAWMADAAVTVNELVIKLASIGASVSRSAAGRWRARFRKHKPGPMSDLRGQVIKSVLVASDEALAAAAVALGIR